MELSTLSPRRKRTKALGICVLLSLSPAADALVTPSIRTSLTPPLANANNSANNNQNNDSGRNFVKSYPQLHPNTQKKSRFSTKMFVRAEKTQSADESKKERLVQSSSKPTSLWPRRIWSRLIRRDTNRDSSTGPLRMQAVEMDEETEALVGSIAMMYDPGFVVREFEELSPDMVLPTETTAAAAAAAATTTTTIETASGPAIDSEYFNVGMSPATIVPSKTGVGAGQDDEEGTNSKSKKDKRNISMARLTGALFENILSGIIERHAIETPEDLSVEAYPQGSILAMLLLGRFRTDAKVRVNRLIFPAIRFSSGTLDVKRMNLNVLGFLPTQVRSASRFLGQFDLIAEDLTFSRHDLLFSPCVRNGLQRLLVRILHDKVQASSIKVSTVDIMPDGKISCTGEAKTLFGSPLSFEVRSGVSFESRGHILTFPGLEVSLNRDIGLFVPVVPHVDIDVGHNARFQHIEIDGKQKHVRLSASVTITPDKTIQLNDYVQSSQAFAAKFSTDIGQWLTEIGNFKK